MTNEEARKIIGNRFLNGFFAAVVKAMDALEQPEIIYCKDCKAFRNLKCVKNNMIAVRDSDYCSRAERKEE